MTDRARASQRSIEAAVAFLFSLFAGICPHSALQPLSVDISLEAPEADLELDSDEDPIVGGTRKWKKDFVTGYKKQKFVDPNTGKTVEIDWY